MSTIIVTVVQLGHVSYSLSGDKDRSHKRKVVVATTLGHHSHISGQGPFRVFSYLMVSVA